LVSALHGTGKGADLVNGLPIVAEPIKDFGEAGTQIAGNGEFCGHGRRQSLTDDLICWPVLMGYRPQAKKTEQVWSNLAGDVVHIPQKIAGKIN
jgi:hypothetical protein